MKYFLKTRLNRVIAILVMTSFLATFLPMYISPSAEAAPARPTGPIISKKRDSFPNRPAQRTEIPHWRSAKTRHFLNPDGTFTAEVSRTSLFYQDNTTKAWKAIDNKLKVSQEPGFAYENSANRFKMCFSRNSGQEALGLFKFDESSFDFSAVSANNAPGLVKEDTITYNSAFNEADLQYKVLSDEIKGSIILNSPQAPNTYSFLLGMNNLSYNEQEDGSVAFYTPKDNNKAAFIIPKPFMFDSSEEPAVSQNVTQKIRVDGEKIYLDIIADTNWLKDSSKNYPITIDPTIVFQHDSQPMMDTFVSSAQPGTNYATYANNNVGNHATYGTTRSYTSFTLPALPDGANITSANASFYASRSVTDSTTVELHKVTSTWDSTSLIWSNQPSYESSALSSKQINSTGWFDFDMTGLVQAWYYGTAVNYGVVLTANPESSDYRSFCSVNHTDQTLHPKVTINYTINPVGDQDFWTYTDDGVNPFNGNLLQSGIDLSIPGRGVPVTIQRSYNSGLAPYWGFFGYGWRSILDMRVSTPTKGPIAFYDASGTTHFFGQNWDGTYASPPGIHYTLTKEGSEYKITTLDNIVYTFNPSGWLIKVTDLNKKDTGTDDQTTYYNRDVNNRVTTIVDPSNRTTSVYYLVNGMVDYIIDTAGRTIDYSYDASYNLIQVTISRDGQSINVQYGYNTPSSHIMTSTTDANSKITSFSYLNGKINTVTRTVGGQSSTNTYTYGTATGTVSGPLGRSATYTFNDNGNVIKTEVTKDSQGNKITTNYTWDNYNNLMSVTDPNSHNTSFGYNANGQIATVTDHNGIGSVFNYDVNNNLVSGKNQIGNVAGASFKNSANISESYDPNNTGPLTDYDNNGNITSATEPLDLAENLINNPGFESSSSGQPSDWTATRTPGANETFSVDSTTKITGSNSLKITSASPSGLGGKHSYFIKVVPGALYNLSAQIKTDSTTTASLTVHWYNDDQSLHSSTTNLSVTKGSTSWSRRSTRVIPPTSLAKVEVVVNGTGTAWFDNIQLEPGSGRTGSNMLTNPSFDNDLDKTGLADGWYPLFSSEGISIDFSTKHSGPASEKMTGGSQAYRDVTQKIDISGDASTKIAFSGWAKSVGGSTGTGRNFAMAIVFNNNDGTNSQWYQVGFDPTNSNWHQRATVVKAEKAFKSITVYAEYYNQTGNAWFDDFEVRKFNTVSSVSSSYNIAENSSFEIDYNNSNWPDRWQNSTQSGTTATFVWEGVEKSFTGEKSVSITNPGGWASITSTRKTPVVSGKTYTVVGYAKTEAVSSVAKLLVHFYDINGAWIAEKQAAETVTGTKDWTRLSLTFNTSEPPASGAAYFAVGVQMQAGSGTSYFDNIRVVQGELQTKYGWNSAGNYVTSITDPKGNVTSFGVDNNTGNVTSVTDPKGNNFGYGYNYLDSLTSWTYPYQATIGGAVFNKTFTYGYDNNGNLTSITNPNNKTINLGYNEINELTTVSEVVSGNTHTATWGYDLLGNLTRADFPNTTYANFEYDNANRLTKIEYGKGSTTSESATFNYFDGGSLKDVTKNAATTTFAYDELDRLTKVTEPRGASYYIQYGYDKASNLTNITNSVSPTLSYPVNYDYNERGQVKQITDNYFNKNVYYLHNEAGQLIKSANQYNAELISTFYTYNNVGQLTELREQKSDGSTSAVYTYGYDANGNITRVDEWISGAGVSYTYDSQNQLQREEYNDGTIITYSYDELGNRISVDRNGVVTTYGYNTEKNRLTSVGGTTYTYDNAGNLTSDGANTYTWDDANRLKQIGNVSFTYDGLGRRDSKNVNGTVENYHFDGDRVAYVTDSSGSTVLKRFTYDASGKPVYMGANGTLYFYHYNAHGDVVKMTDLSGNTVAEYKYDAWGNITYQSGSVAGINPYRYAGYWYDSETGLYYLQARYYKPNIGRFISKDPVLGQNDYAYCDNNPVNLYDPDGLKPSLINRFSNGFINVVVRPISDALDPGPTTWGALKSTGFAVVGAGAFVAIKGYAMVNTIGAITGATLYGNKLADKATPRIVNGFKAVVHTGKQGKHIPGHPNFQAGRSIFTGNAQKLLDKFAGRGQWIGQNKERINFGQVIGKYVDPATGKAFNTTKGIIHYSKDGAHIVPARP